MIRLDYLLFGYKIFTVDSQDVGKCAQIFLKNGVSVSFDKNRFVVGAGKSRTVEALLKNKIKYSVSSILGFRGFLYRNRKRYGAIIAMIIISLVFLFSSDAVWDVRVEVEDSELAEKIENELSLCGFGIGSSWSKSDLGKIEVDVLSKSESVSWLNINRRGTVAYVSVIEKIAREEPIKKEGYSNVVATCDAVIEEITVLRGVAVVRAGDVVKKGDLLISGVLPEENGGGFCYAEGIVVGRISDSVEVSVPSSYEVKKSEKAKISACKIKIFDFYINIFDFNRKTHKECDIIESEKSITVLEKDIPISVYRRFSVPYTIETAVRSAEETVSMASEQMSKSLSERLASTTLVRINTVGEFSDSAYTMKTNFVCLEKIGTDMPFEAIEKDK